MQEYDERARARWVDEPPKRVERTSFERDRARLVHSAALRRLAAKTQVVGPTTDDFVRNRLTHTLEVAQVARDLGRTLGCDADLVETAALAHDLGHPPFGHNGERALDQVSEACGGFEGNAQTLRLLTRLEAKTLDADGRSVGLNLTRATLDASTKYPWPRSAAPVPVGLAGDSGGGGRKFGVYDDDLAVFTWMREGATGRRRCVEAQVMDLADDVAYSVHDLEDGVVAGLIDLPALADDGLRHDVWTTVRGWYLPDSDDAELDAAYQRLRAIDAWPTASYDGSRRALAALKNLTSDVIGVFCGSVQHATRDVHGTEPLVRHAADLVVPRETAAEIGVLKGIAARFVMEAPGRVEVMDRQRVLLHELFAALDTGGPDLLDPQFRLDYEVAVDDAARIRVLLDQIASLTDGSAVAWHRRLVRPSRAAGA